MSHFLRATVLILSLCACAPIHSSTVTLPPTITGAAPVGDVHYGITHAEPRYIDNEHNGIRILSIQPESIADTMGLRAGDVILAMAGIPCTGVRRCRTGEETMRHALHQRRPFTLLIERYGTLLRMTMRYDAFRPLFQ